MRSLWKNKSFRCVDGATGSTSNPNRSLTDLRSPSKSIRNSIIINLLTFLPLLILTVVTRPCCLWLAHPRSYLSTRWRVRQHRLLLFLRRKRTKILLPLPYLLYLLHYPPLPFHPILGPFHAIITPPERMMLINIRTAFHFRWRRGWHLMHHVIR